MGALCKVLFYASSSPWGWGHADVSWAADGWVSLTEYTSLLAVAKEQQEWRKTDSDIQTLEISLWASALFRKCPRVLINSRLWMKMAFYSAHIRLHELQIRLTSLVYIRFIGNVKYAATFWAFQKVAVSANLWICVLSTHVWNVFACTRVCAFMHVWWDSPPPPADTRCRALNCITQAWLTGTFWNSEGANLIVCSPHLPCNEEESRKYKELHQQMRCVMRLWKNGWRLWRTRWLCVCTACPGDRLSVKQSGQEWWASVVFSSFFSLRCCYI